MARLKDVLELGVRVTLVTTACHSGGWATSPDFNHTTMAASDETTTKHGTSNAWGVCQSIGRGCGSDFANSVQIQFRINSDSVTIQTTLKIPIISYRLRRRLNWPSYT